MGIPELRISNIDMVSIKDLKPHPKNMNVHTPEQIARLAKIIEYQGWRYPIKISRQSGFITSGHARLEAAKLMGWDKVPVSPQNYDDETQEYADVVSDNSIAAWSELDLSSINNEIVNLGPDFDIDLLGLKDFVLEPADKFDPQCDEDKVPENAETRCKLGDRWILGKHTLVCGDSTDICAVDLLMMGEKAEMCFTDPPYGVDYSGGMRFADDGSVEKNGRKRLANDKNDDIYTDVIPVIAMNVDGPAYTWFAGSLGCKIYPAIENVGQVHTLLVWNKINAGFGALNANYKQKHEPFLYWKPKGSTLRWDGPTNEITIWEQKREGKNKFHPTQKPVELAERAINNHKAKSVLDLFGGSGSTLIACEKTNRKCFMMELDPHYCDVIIERWEKYTGKKAELQASGPVEDSPKE